MKIKASEWNRLTTDEKLICLEYAAWESQKRMKKAIKG